MVRFTVRLKDDLHARVTEESQKNGKYISEIIESALLAWLRRDSTVAYIDTPVVIMRWEDYEKLKGEVAGEA